MNNQLVRATAESQTKEVQGQIGGRDLVQHQSEMYKLIFDSLYSGAVVTDTRGYITHMNRPYADFLGVDPDEQIGRHCTEVIEGSRMHIVAKTGKAEMAQIHRIKGRDMVIQRIPIKKNGEIIGVLGQLLFKDLLAVKKLFERLSILENKLELYEKEIFSLRSTRYTMDSIIGVSNVMLALKKDALKAVAESCTKKKTGARGLRSVLEERMLDVMYRIPSLERVTRCVVTKDTILNRSDPILYFDEDKVRISELEIT